MSKLSEQYGPHCIGNVIRILDEYTIIVDIGKSRLQIGDQIAVYEYGEPICDLSGNVLSNYEFIKAKLEVVDVNDSYSVCKSQTTTKNVRPLSPIFETTVTKRKPLNIDNASIEPLNQYNSRIKKGDPIKKY